MEFVPEKEMRSQTWQLPLWSRDGKQRLGHLCCSGPCMAGPRGCRVAFLVFQLPDRKPRLLERTKSDDNLDVVSVTRIGEGVRLIQ